MSTKDEPVTEPFDQISRVVKQVSDALHEASTKTANSNRHITERVMQQAEDNARQLFDTLQTMASTRNPSDIARIYTDFLANSAQKHASQLLEIGQVLAKASRDTWGPVNEAIQAVATTKRS